MSNARDKANIPALNFSSTGIDDNATSTAITIDSSENVGIGATSPISVSSNNLTVSGSASSSLFFEDTGYEASGNGLFSLTYDDGNLKFETASRSGTGRTGNAERMRIDSSGEVGIGTTSPDDKLHVVGNVFLEDSSPEITFETTGTSKSNWQIAVQENIDQALEISVGSADADASNDSFSPVAVFKNSGTVGIGVNNPTHTLHVEETTGNIDTPIAFFKGRRVKIDGSASANSPRLILSLDDTEKTELMVNRVSEDLSISNLTNNDILFNTNSTERMRLTSTGLGIGTSAPKEKLDSRGSAVFSGNHATSANAYGTAHGVMIHSVGGVGKITAISNGANDVNLELRGLDGGSANSNQLVLDGGSNRVGIGGSSPARKLQVANGFIGASESSSNISTDQYNEFADNSANWYNTKFANFSSNPASQYMIEVAFRSSSPDSSGAKFFQMLDQTTARVNINSDGDIQNHDNSYGGISDERIKQDIVDASSQWEDIKNIRIRKYKKKHDVIQYGEENAPIELGVISQELETVSPGLVKEDKADSSHADLHDDFTGENPQNVKYVKYSILYMKAVKALQEAMERIETLETKVQTLENNNP